MSLIAILCHHLVLSLIQATENDVYHTLILRFLTLCDNQQIISLAPYHLSHVTHGTPLEKTKEMWQKEEGEKEDHKQCRVKKNASF